jgi:hypothetical protein
MASSVGDVVAQLKAVIERIDKMAVASAHAQADAGDSHGFYTEAGQGTNHPDVEIAVTNSREAAEKAGEVARFLTDATSSLATYLNQIAPGSMRDVDGREYGTTPPLHSGAPGLLPVPSSRDDQASLDESLPASRKRISPEAIAFGGSATTTLWATFADLLPALPKTIGTTAMSAVATWGAYLTWRGKKRERRSRDAD